MLYFVDIYANWYDTQLGEALVAILEGMVAAFEFFGAVPREVWWDNPRAVVQLIFKGRERRPNPYYQALASHYTFAAGFCMPARG